MFYEIKSNDQKQLPVSRYNIPVLDERNNKIELPILNDNYLICGVTGFGKTTFIKKMISQLSNSDNTYFVFFELKDDFRTFLKKDDKVISYRDIEGMNTFKWNMCREIVQSKDWVATIDKMANMFFAEYDNDSRNKIWISQAKNVFKAFIKAVLYHEKCIPSNYTIINAMKKMSAKEFVKYLSLYEPNKEVLNYVFEYNGQENYSYPKKAHDVMFFLSDVLSKWGGTFFNSDGKDTIHDFLDGKYGKKLFLLYDYNKRDSITFFYRYFLQEIISERLSQEVDRSKKVILCLDEITELGADFGLLSAATIGRGNKLQLIVSTQSLEKLYAIAPDVKYGDHLVSASLSGFRTIVSFNINDDKTVNYVQALFGGKEKKTTLSFPISKYDKPTTIVQEEFIIENSQLRSLDVGEMIIKYGGCRPQKVKIIL